VPYLLERVDDAVGRVLVEALDACPVDEVDQIHLPARHLHGRGRGGGGGGRGGRAGGGGVGGGHGLARFGSAWLPEASGRARGGEGEGGGEWGSAFERCFAFVRACGKVEVRIRTREVTCDSSCGRWDDDIFLTWCGRAEYFKQVQGG
jgi:hypothetical protein